MKRKINLIVFLLFLTNVGSQPDCDFKSGLEKQQVKLEHDSSDFQKIWIVLPENSNDLQNLFNCTVIATELSIVFKIGSKGDPSTIKIDFINYTSKHLIQGEACQNLKVALRLFTSEAEWKDLNLGMFSFGPANKVKTFTLAELSVDQAEVRWSTGGKKWCASGFRLTMSGSNPVDLDGSLRRWKTKVDPCKNVSIQIQPLFNNHSGTATELTFNTFPDQSLFEVNQVENKIEYREDQLKTCPAVVLIQYKMTAIQNDEDEPVDLILRTSDQNSEFRSGIQTFTPEDLMKNTDFHSKFAKCHSYKVNITAEIEDSNEIQVSVNLVQDLIVQTDSKGSIHFSQQEKGGNVNSIISNLQKLHFPPFTLQFQEEGKKEPVKLELTPVNALSLIANKLNEKIDLQQSSTIEFSATNPKRKDGIDLTEGIKTVLNDLVSKHIASSQNSVATTEENKVIETTIIIDTEKSMVTTMFQPTVINEEFTQTEYITSTENGHDISKDIEHDSSTEIVHDSSNDIEHDTSTEIGHDISKDIEHDTSKDIEEIEDNSSTKINNLATEVDTAKETTTPVSKELYSEDKIHLNKDITEKTSVDSNITNTFVLNPTESNFFPGLNHLQGFDSETDNALDFDDLFNYAGNILLSNLKERTTNKDGGETPENSQNIPPDLISKILASVKQTGAASETEIKDLNSDLVLSPDSPDNLIKQIVSRIQQNNKNPSKQSDLELGISPDRPDNLVSQIISMIPKFVEDYDAAKNDKKDSSKTHIDLDNPNGLLNNIVSSILDYKIESGGEKSFIGQLLSSTQEQLNKGKSSNLGVLIASFISNIEDKDLERSQPLTQSEPNQINIPDNEDVTTIPELTETKTIASDEPEEMTTVAVENYNQTKQVESTTATLNEKTTSKVATVTSAKSKDIIANPSSTGKGSKLDTTPIVLIGICILGTTIFIGMVAILSGIAYRRQKKKTATTIPIWENSANRQMAAISFGNNNFNFSLSEEEEINGISTENRRENMSLVQFGEATFNTSEDNQEI